ncbi:MAG: DUF4132 domain-containing protein [Xanthomonadaceae bacterium]|nr:DUF4132 domain-containing protein [Xanthomonadaceae bacterium]
MLGWISQLLGGGSADLPAGVPAEWAKALETQLSPLDKVKGLRAGFARDALRYVLHGEPLSVLQDAAQHDEICAGLGLAGYVSDEQKAAAQRAALYATFESIPVEVMLRWGQFLAASLKPQHWGAMLKIAGNAEWAEALLLHASGRRVNVWGGDAPVVKGVTAAGIERLLDAAGIAPSALAVAAFGTPIDSTYSQAEVRAKMFATMRDYSDAVLRHRDAVRPLLAATATHQRRHMLNLLATLNDTALREFVGEIVEFAASSSKQARAAAEPLVLRCADAAIEPLKALAASGKPEQRQHTLRLLWTFAGKRDDEALRAFARETATADKAATVQSLVQEWDAAVENHAAMDAYEYDVPEIASWVVAATPAFDAALKRLWNEINTSIERSNKQAREHYERGKAQGHNWRLHQEPEFSGSDFENLRNYLAGAQPRWRGEHRQRNVYWQHAGPALQKLAGDAVTTPVALTKLLNYFGLLGDRDRTPNYVAVNAFNALHRATGTPTLLELAKLVEPFGVDANGVLGAYCYGWNSVLGKDWPNEAVWPFFAHHLDVLEQRLRMTSGHDYSFDRKGLFRAVATFPTPPASLINAMFDLALGTAKSERAPAQVALANLPGKEARIVAALEDGKSEVRAVAAQWLHALRHEPAIPALEAAVAKEKHDVAKGAMLDALQALGRPVERYLDRDKLVAEARKALAKDAPKDLAWFPWAALPAVHWADHGEAVPDDVLRWFLVQAVKQKSPEPNAVLRKYCGMFAPREREALGQWVLETWMAEDIRPIAPEAAMKQAQSHAQAMHGYMNSHPQYYKDDPNFGKSVEELVVAYLPGFLRQPAGSAIGSKGLLAVAAACAAERAAAPTGRYLKEYYGTRAAQGKALIAMLAWIEHPTATQLMLSIGSRFRTKSFQEEATRQAEALADRKGWTLAELADRTMPSAGFDESGVLELSYGERAFVAKLMPDFKIELFNPDGKKIANLPEPRLDDDAEHAKDAKKALSNAKKEIKNIATLQTDRLYEALCTERDWPAEDWARYLNRHPVVRRLCQRLIWCVVEGDKTLATFRPLDDGSLTDVDDNAIELPADARVRIAHDSNLDAETVARWQQHLLDYEVKPLFQQLGKGTYALPENRRKDTAIVDFEGHLIEAFALRGRALKLGYTRGPAEDGGWFHVYEKRFPTLGLNATIEFTGNPLPEENRTVALLKLSFSPAGESGWQRGETALEDVPKVLLSECYNDLRLIAADGSGYDAEWQKKSEY